MALHHKNMHRNDTPEIREQSSLVLVTPPKNAQGFPCLEKIHIDLPTEVSPNVIITTTVRWQSGQTSSSAQSISRAFQQALHQHDIEFPLQDDKQVNRLNVILISFGLQLRYKSTTPTNQTVKQCGTDLWIRDECIAQFPSDGDDGRINLTPLSRMVGANPPLALLTALGFSLNTETKQLITPNGARLTVRWERTESANWLEVIHDQGEDYLLEVQDEQHVTWLELRCLHWLYGL